MPPYSIFISFHFTGQKEVTSLSDPQPRSLQHLNVKLVFKSSRTFQKAIVPLFLLDLVPKGTEFTYMPLTIPQYDYISIPLIPNITIARKLILAQTFTPRIRVSPSNLSICKIREMEQRKYTRRQQMQHVETGNHGIQNSLHKMR